MATTNKISDVSSLIINELKQSDVQKAIKILEQQRLNYLNSTVRPWMQIIGVFYQDLEPDSNAFLTDYLSDLIYYDPKDKLSVSAVDDCIGYFLGENASNDRLGRYADYHNTRFLYPGAPKLPLKPIKESDKDKIRNTFFSKWMYPSEGSASTHDPVVYQRMIYWLLIRLKAILSYYTNNKTGSIFEYVASEELKASSEEEEQRTGDVSSPIAADYLDRLFKKIYKYDQLVALKKEYVISRAFASSTNTVDQYREVDQDRKNAFWKIFYPLRTNTVTEKLSADQMDTLFSKLEASGLLALASYAGDITNFAKKRLYELGKNNTQVSGLIQSGVDAAWLEQLTTTTSYLTRDPILLSIINVYFPSLVAFYFEAVSIATDYSNNGQGGGEEDDINNPDLFISSLEQAFGTRDGKKIFEHASKFNNTQKRMDEVLKNSPYRQNISPEAPDVFHLRLGAANFYVPPLSIDVNTSFMTGSLTGGALRQKNTPKFNAGHKETSIRMRLFFPNYEEIWGISIDEASEVRLTDNFEIDFKTGGTSEKKIDKFLSSLRGLIAAFKYSPFLPVRNFYLNSVHGITGVALSNISVSTVPNFPFALAVDIELLNFNHKPFMPMISDFNQAIHWGKYRQYMGKAAGVLHNYVNGDFLIKNIDQKNSEKASDQETKNPKAKTDIEIPTSINDFKGQKFASYENEVLTTNIFSEWMNGNHISFFVPAETQTKIFLPDNTMFRSDQEKNFKDYGTQGFWESVLKYFGIVDINSSYKIPISQAYSLANSNQIPPRAKTAVKNALDILTAGVNSDSAKRKVYQYLQTIFIQQNPGLTKSEKNYIEDYDSKDQPSTPAVKDYIFNGESLSGLTIVQIKARLKDNASKTEKYLDVITKQQTDKKAKSLKIKIPTGSWETGNEQYKNLYKNTRDEIRDAFNVSILERFYQSGPIQQLMEAMFARNGSFQFNEWEVPMIKIDLDPKDVTVTGVSVSTGNVLSKLQLQMQDEPTYQHIGGRDTNINISMTVIGEKELTKIKRIFDHISSLARLEHSTGVLGFMGIKNIITALCGVKYVVPLNYSVNTRPNYPHVYDVQISLMDFDIFQQTREKLDSSQQTDLIQHFKTKKNPFLRIKQMWGSFNTYPDFPLQIKDKDNNVVGHLDPDFYFRSFEIYDNDVIYNISKPKGEMPSFMNDEDVDDVIDRLKGELPEGMASAEDSRAPIIDLIIQWMREYSSISDAEAKRQKISTIVSDLDSKGIKINIFLQILSAVSSNVDLVDLNKEKFSASQRRMLILDFIEYSQEEPTTDEEAAFTNKVYSAPYKVGNVYSGSQELFSDLASALAGEYNVEGEEEVSFDPDSLTAHCIISMMPIRDPEEPNKIPAIMCTAYGTNFGYIDSEKDGRFYLTVAGDNVRKKAKPQPVTDPTSPEYGAKNATTFSGAAAFSDYQQTVSQGAGDLPEVMSNGAPKQNSVAKHWEKMLVDTQYRDVSGRMIRAFPTYMLWLIDEGGYFAGVKMFDNFYGLQSIIDFSVVSSEDLLGDTLVFRVSNLYSKLTKKESEKIFGTDDEYNQDNPTLTDGLSSIVDNTLNKAKNILAHMRSDYVVDIQNIRLKPGVRVHLRGGYGSNPNSLQTLFNGTITEVQTGDIITVTAQSDAIELGAVVNSTNKKGDSGKIDGGINTGLWLSEPRDLMVRLLTMGSSRFREGISYASRGLVFSENKFGIRHFGSILYEPMNENEMVRHQARVDAISGAYELASTMNAGKIGAAATEVAAKSVGYGITDVLGISTTQGFRSPVFNLMSQMWSNFSSQRDIEIFKRNIYPGNGTGIAQFLGGDLGDGWTSVASVTPENIPNDRLEYLSRLTDVTWNKLVANQQATGINTQDAKRVYEDMVADNNLIASGSAKIASGLASVGVGAAISVFLPVTGVAIGGAGLLGVLSGRGGTNLFRMTGLVSANDDDDMPGFDEVSFRAQTYMRTVWDLFQTCAKLLPNYIVAVRPFEDRSTVFYGKPHWLYTSGVVPVTTGYPGDEKAAELGIITPTPRSPDSELLDIILNLNKETTPYQDAEAFLRGKEPIDAMQKMLEMQSRGEGVFETAAALKGKVINLNSSMSSTVVDENGNTIAKLPKKTGNVYVGYHLPVGAETEDITEAKITSHLQVPQLPTRFSYPFFTDKLNDDFYLSNYSYVPFYKGKDSSKKLEAFRPSDEFNYKVGGGKTSFEETYKIILQAEDDFLKQKYKNLNEEAANEVLSNTVDFIPFTQSIISSGSVKIEGKVRMPFPENKTASELISLANQNDLENYIPSIEYSKKDISYTEWGYPETPVDEQFYIAMRWPYNPGFDSTSLSEWKKNYFPNKENETLYGTIKDYKDQHVLVYNPSNGVIVVCKPAYFLWGEDEGVADWSELPPGTIDALVSPDAAYYLGILTGGNVLYFDSSTGPGDVDTIGSVGDIGYAVAPVSMNCVFSFVPNSIPLGVAVTSNQKITPFYLQNNEDLLTDDLKQLNLPSALIGFGTFNPISGSKNIAAVANGTTKDILNEYTSGTSKLAYQDFRYGGNYKGYLHRALKGGSENFAKITAKAGWDILDKELATTGDENTGTGRVAFADVYDPLDEVSITSRKYYDEDFDPTSNVIAGNGRTLTQARDIWDQFRFGYHEYDHVKKAFWDMYGLDPDAEEELPNEIKQIIFKGKDIDTVTIFDKFNSTGNSGLDEFSILFGSDWFNESGEQNQTIKTGAQYATDNFIDASIESGGIIEYFDLLVKDKLKKFYSNYIEGNIQFLNGYYYSENFNPVTAQGQVVADSAGNFRAIDEYEYQLYLYNTGKRSTAPVKPTLRTEDAIADLSNVIKTPKQLFLVLVGLFRQRMWEDAYSRAWLVLKPNRKMTGKGVEGQWDFSPVTKVFAAFINPNDTYGKDKKKFLELLYKTRGEGNSHTSIVGKALGGLDGFLDRTIGPLITAAGDALQGLIQAFKLNMLQMGYGLSQIGNFAKQANILNKVLNDSIYYAMGQPGSLLRAVDNPFTREYGEPVVEIREPFQRIHYLNSFSHILSNQIQENINNVSTAVTAVSDGKYPVTVALDKGLSADRQTEMTVETGIYFDNVVGSGFFGFLHPFLHPFETGRGVSKAATGAPDELSAKRIALGHLKESLKDIYGGELLIIGNADIRPHDLVYIADVYERMYGIFEVEQVIHHFTPELGYVTSITPNALVSINDPARWYMTSWIHSWLSVQNIRNDTRIYLDSLRASNTGISLGGEISVDSLAETLSPQMIGAMQYTNGSSALIKDIVASSTAENFPDISSSIRDQAQKNGNNGIVGGKAIAAGIAASSIPLIGKAVWKGWQWVRDNLMDQHGCYIQYLNKNGQAMDGGLAYNQGMVVGRYHSKALLPGVLGSRVQAKTPDGYSYVRTDDIFKSLGWKENQISTFVRYSSYENALVHAQVLNLSGLGPEKAQLEPMFKVVCTLDTSRGHLNSGVEDADTIYVKDILSSPKQNADGTYSQPTFTVRLDGINAKEKSQFNFHNRVKRGNITAYREGYRESEPGVEIVIFTAQTTQDSSGVTPALDLKVGDTVKISGVSENLDRTYRVAFVNENLFIVQKSRTQEPSKELANFTESEWILYGTNSKTAKFETIEVDDGSAMPTAGVGNKATSYVIEKLKGKVFVLRIAKSRASGAILSDKDFEAGTLVNKESNYLKEIYGRTLGTVFYQTSSQDVSKFKDFVYSIFNKNNKENVLDIDKIKLDILNSLSSEIFNVRNKASGQLTGRFTNVLNTLMSQMIIDHSKDYPDNINLKISEQSRLFSALVEIKALDQLYSNSSKWPLILWDEFYDDGTSATLNWELVGKGFADVFTNNLLTQSDSFQDFQDGMTKPREV